jgi:hypothetical protein
VRCGRCGNDNTEPNRFCGMCGAPLLAKPQTDVPPPAPIVPPKNIAPPRPLPIPMQPSPPEAAYQSSPGISGPSFLGLNTPPPSRDPLQPSSKNLDYLLEDDDEPPRAWGKLILIVIALALALGFGYLHWKQGGFDWVTGSAKKPPASTSVPDGSQSSPDSAAPTSAPATPDAAAPASSANQTATPPATSGAQNSPPQTNSQSGNNAPAQTTVAPSEVPPGEVQPNKSQTDNPPAGSAPADSAPPTTSSDSDNQSTQAEEPAVAKSPARKPAAAKPSAAKPVDTVTEAERYIYGRGVRQDCDRGVRLLKPAAQPSNPKAMISLGALYSTGTCTPRDLPTAYRWFALALHQQPNNQPLQDDLQKLWSQMTQPERQLAIKLSQ